MFLSLISLFLMINKLTLIFSVHSMPYTSAKKEKEKWLVNSFEWNATCAAPPVNSPLTLEIDLSRCKKKMHNFITFLENMGPIL